MRRTASGKGHTTCRPARPKVGLGMPDRRRDASADRDAVAARDKGTLWVVLQPAHASSSPLTDALHRSAASSSPERDGKTMTSFDNVQNGLLEVFRSSKVGAGGLTSFRSAL